MKLHRRIPRLAGLLLLPAVVLSPAGCQKRARVEVLASRLPPGWAVKVLEVTQPELVDLAPRSFMGGTMPPSPTGAVKGARWLLARVNLKVPQVGATIAASRIRLLTPGDVEFGLNALTSAAAGTKPVFVKVEDSHMLGRLDARGEMAWMTIRNAESGQMEISFQKTEPLEIYLLFTVPAGERQFRLVF